MPGIDFRALKELVSMDQVLDLLRWEPSTREGEELRGYCPLHSTHPHNSRSFAVSAAGFFCHKCKRNGDQLALYAQVKRLGIFEAAKELCKLLGHAVPWRPGKGVRPQPGGNSEEER